MSIARNQKFNKFWHMSQTCVCSLISDFLMYLHNGFSLIMAYIAAGGCNLLDTIIFKDMHSIFCINLCFSVKDNSYEKLEEIQSHTVIERKKEKNSINIIKIIINRISL